MERVRREVPAPPALDEASAPLPVTAPEHMIALQKTAGNRAVTAMLARWDGGVPPTESDDATAPLEPTAGPDAGTGDAGDASGGAGAPGDGAGAPDGGGSGRAGDGGTRPTPAEPTPVQPAPVQPAPSPAPPGQLAGGPDIGPLQAPERQFEVQIPALAVPPLTELPATATLPADWRRRRRNRFGRIPLPELGTGEFEGIAEIRQFATDLAALTASRRGGDAATVFASLVTAYSEYVQGARVRFGQEWQGQMRGRIARAERAASRRRRGERAPTPEVIEAAVVAARTEQFHWAIRRFQQVRRGWMIGRREQLDFDTRMTPRARGLGNLAPGAAGQAERVPIAPYGSGHPIHPGLRDFLHILHGNPRATVGAASPNIDRTFRANNYSLGHGSGHVGGMGLSVDLTLANAPLDDRGFWRFNDAVALLMRVHTAATELGGNWLVLYNDFAVANEVNARTGGRHVVFTGNTSHQRPARRGDPPGRVTGLNWHGPEVLHFHLDFTPAASGREHPAVDR